MVDVQKIQWKVFFQNPAAARPELCFKIFNRWIPNSPEIFVDVADYRHVHDGPLTILVGHHADCVLDASGRRLGFLYAQKTLVEGDNVTKIRCSLEATIQAVHRFASDPLFGGELVVQTDCWQLICNDRALVPNSPQTFQNLSSAITQAVEPILGRVRLESMGRAKERLTVQVTALAPSSLTQLHNPS